MVLGSLGSMLTPPVDLCCDLAAASALEISLPPRFDDTVYLQSPLQTDRLESGQDKLLQRDMV